MQNRAVFDNNHMLQIKIDYQNRDQKNPPQNIEGVDVCERCGRNLNELGQYKDYIHYRKDNRDIPCIGEEVFSGVYEEELEGTIWPQLPDRSWVQESRERNAQQS